MRAQRARETIESYEREGAAMDFAVSTDELAEHEAHIRVESVGRGHVCSCVGTGAGQLQVCLTDEPIEIVNGRRIMPAVRVNALHRTREEEVERSKGAWCSVWNGYWYTWFSREQTIAKTCRNC